MVAALQDLKKPLRVVFIGPGGVPEEGLDEGGVSREFFQLVVSTLPMRESQGAARPEFIALRLPHRRLAAMLAMWQQRGALCFLSCCA